MRKLIEGVLEFREQRLPELEARFAELAHGQAPETLFIACSDSRVVPHMLVSSDPGDLFVMRNVGNLVPPATEDGHSTGDVSEASAIEYAVLALEVKNIVVCGHSACGAMKAVATQSGVPGAPNLVKWLGHADAALARLKADGPLDPSLAEADQLSQLNVLVQMEHLQTYPIVRARMAANELTIGGCWFDIANAQLLVYRPRLKRFTAIDHEAAAEMIALLESVTPHAH